MDEFWSRRGVKTLGLRRTFDFVTRDNAAIYANPTAHEPEPGQSSSPEELRAFEYSQLADVLHDWLSQEDTLPGGDDPNPTSNEPLGSSDAVDTQQEDAVFLRSYIPRTLNDVYDPERDVAMLKKGDGKHLIYGGVTGVLAIHEANASQLPQTNEKAPKEAPREDIAGEASDNEGLDDDVESGGEDDDNSFEERQPRGHRHEDKDAKKVCMILIECNLLFIFMT